MENYPLTNFSSSKVRHIKLHIKMSKIFNYRFFLKRKKNDLISFSINDFMSLNIVNKYRIIL